jgi:7-cyano-7-deazaguanine synthase in queuosine biosynthesis
MSGGVDSLLLFAANKNAIGLHFRYKHPAALKELEAVEKIANLYGREVMLITLPLDASSAQKHTYKIPGRNQLFLTVAAMQAITEGCDAVLYGACADDFEAYEDCRPDFVSALNAVHSTTGLPLVCAPLAGMSKKEIHAAARALPGYEFVSSCYVGEDCGKCGSCLSNVLS